MQKSFKIIYVFDQKRLLFCSLHFDIWFKIKIKPLSVIMSLWSKNKKSHSKSDTFSENFPSTLRHIHVKLSNFSSFIFNLDRLLFYPKLRALIINLDIKLYWVSTFQRKIVMLTFLLDFNPTFVSILLLKITNFSCF